MAKILATRGSQYGLTAEYVFNLTDSFVNTSNAEEQFSAVATHVLDAIKLPPGAIVSAGSVTTEVAASGATVSVAVGDVNNTQRYLATTDKSAAGITPLVPTGYVGSGEDIRLTVTVGNAAATAGKIAVRVTYHIRNRMNESQTS